MAGVAVVTDSTASLTRIQSTGANITTIPLQVVIDEVSRPESDDDVTPAVVAEALRTGRRVSTSRPPPEAFAATYGELADAGYDAIVSVHLSRAMSATWEAASRAAESATLPVFVVDSTTLAMATGFAVLAGAETAAAGGSPGEVAEQVRRRAVAASTFFYVDTLEHLRGGGRIGPAAALLGSALSVKPLLTVTRGSIRPYERVRTAAKALARLEELAAAACAKAARVSDQVDVAVHHLDEPDRAAALADRLGSRSPSATISIAEVSAVLAVHVGPGVLGVVISPRV